MERKKSQNNSDNFEKKNKAQEKSVSPLQESLPSQSYPKCVGWQRKKLGDQWDGIANPDGGPKVLRERVFVCLFICLRQGRGWPGTHHID